MSRPSGRSSTRSFGSTPTDLESLPAGVLEPAIHAVFVASVGVAVTLVLAAALMPKRVDEVVEQPRPQAGSQVSQDPGGAVV